MECDAFVVKRSGAGHLSSKTDPKTDSNHLLLREVLKASPLLTSRSLWARIVWEDLMDFSWGLNNAVFK